MSSKPPESIDAPLKSARRSAKRNSAFPMVIAFLIVGQILAVTMGSWTMGLLFGLQTVLFWGAFCGPVIVRVFCTGLFLGAISGFVIQFAFWEPLSGMPGTTPTGVNSPVMSPFSNFDKMWMQWLGVNPDEPSLDQSTLVFTIRTSAAGLLGGVFALAAWYWLGARRLLAWLKVANRSLSQRVRRRWNQLPAPKRRFLLVAMWTGYGVVVAGWVAGLWWRPFGPALAYSLGLGLFLLFIAIAALQLRSSQPK